MKKQEIEFDPDKLHLFRVSLLVNESKVTQHQIQLKINPNAPDTLPFKDNYVISFQQLNLQHTSNQMLNNNQSYLVYSPYTLFLWHG